jgi:hypothetical protein
VYTIDNSKNHDEGMKMLDDAGIYLALDANTPKYSLNRETNATLHRSYNDVYLQNVFATVEAFHDYNNLLVFFSGNEVINQKNNTGAATYIKATTRDMKRFIKEKSPRPIPVGYSAADVRENIEEQALFFNCGSDDERSDFFAFNDYSWCDPQTFTGAGWDKKVEMYESYSKPIFLSEFGCITNRRDWGEIASIYHTNMTSVYSGGLAYEYTVEPNGYGLVEVSSSGSIEPNDDFKRLKTAYEKTSNPRGDGGFKENGKASQCPPASENWEVETSDLPATPKKAEAFMTKGAGKAVGLTGEGSHFAGDASESTAPSGSGSSSSESGQSNSGSGAGESNAAGALELPVRSLAMVAASVVFSAALLL